MHIPNTTILASFLFLLQTPIQAALNEPCHPPSGTPGVCLQTSTCRSSGGIPLPNLCPSSPASIQCCTKPVCGPSSASTSKGNCRWTSDCPGKSLSNQCPGPAGFKCCQSAAQGFGGYAAPRMPVVGGCKRVAVEATRKVVERFPGRVREVGCVRACGCGSGSDHCCGKAVDLMCSDAGGTATLSGKEIAEWIMNNRGRLNLKYVIWGQKIWNPSQDKVKGWKNWRTMEDRGDITANHWDHVHVSFN
ncbi:hypothetical protein BS50DRAFT_611283 [Corynespora cassiicola Philippines]|uniref:ARB-07466-like C-terminal domain-containing protein n=1 Tax=Corynespora cassiicola Philippines TaxID=1448308 RepID=A0A2T2NID2_CORCC|nr:hypothetical protein BS50DRAFT_611283 [Corynespora cassiicola Philippines]